MARIIEREKIAMQVRKITILLHANQRLSIVISIIVLLLTSLNLLLYLFSLGPHSQFQNCLMFIITIIANHSAQLVLP